MLTFLLKFFLAVAIIAAAFGFFYSWQTQRAPEGQVFLQGTVPETLPDGFYEGTLSGRKYAWIGKKFDAPSATGTDVFNDGFDSINERNSFTISVGKGLLDKNLQVVKLNYNVPGNSFWQRFVFAEMVQVAPDRYLGKTELKIIPNYPFAILYFELKKPVG